MDIFFFLLTLSDAEKMPLVNPTINISNSKTQNRKPIAILLLSMFVLLID
jgi:hypothetical protein